MLVADGQPHHRNGLSRRVRIKDTTTTAQTEIRSGGARQVNMVLYGHVGSVFVDESWTDGVTDHVWSFHDGIRPCQ